MSTPDTSTWQPVADLAETQLGATARGCPHCGSRTTITTDDGRTITYPSVECCPPAIKRQIRWREEDIRALNRRRAEREQALEQLRESLDELPTRAARAAAEAKLARSERNSATRDREDFTPRLRELNAEVARLNAKLTAITRRDA